MIYMHTQTSYKPCQYRYHNTVLLNTSTSSRHYYECRSEKTFLQIFRGSQENLDKKCFLIRANASSTHDGIDVVITTTRI